MSLRARSLLALGCVALLHATSLDRGADVPADTALHNYQNGHCTTEIRGYKSRSSISLPEVVIPTGQKEIALSVRDKCAELGMEIVGGVVTACDENEPPRLELPPLVVGAGAVHRRGALSNATARCFVKLYCI